MNRNDCSASEFTKYLTRQSTDVVIAKNLQVRYSSFALHTDKYNVGAFFRYLDHDRLKEALFF